MTSASESANIPPEPPIGTGQTTDTAAALQAGYLLAKATQQVNSMANAVDPSGLPFVFVHGRPVSMEEFLLTPVRQKLKVTLADAPSFCDFLKRFSTPQTIVFCLAHPLGGSFTAHLDYPGAKVGEENSWNERQVHFSPEFTEEFTAWRAADGGWMTQEQFCEFVEVRRRDFQKPGPADMLEIARGIEAKQHGEFKSGMRLSNGDRELTWVSATTATAGRGNEKFEIPEEITIAVEVFEGGGGARTTIGAYLRYRIINGAIGFKVELQNVEEIVREALGQTRAHIATETGLPIFNAGK